mmetsp:Transcript_2595/g.4377  ORF Transcript_2595/g.4377 Transcript_2595/m.4377 type:complete len:304 (+) Transcript_2595:35-946(+)
MATSPGTGPSASEPQFSKKMCNVQLFVERIFLLLFFQTTSHIFLRQPRESLPCETPISGPGSKFEYFLASGAQIEPSIRILELGLLLLLEVLQVAKHAALGALLDEEPDAEGQAHGADGEEAGAEEVVFPAEPGGGAQDERFGALESRHVEVCLHLELDGLPRLDVAGDGGVELAELGESGGAHPHLKSVGVDAEHGGNHFRKRLVQVLRVRVVGVPVHVRLPRVAPVVSRLVRREGALKGLAVFFPLPQRFAVAAFRGLEPLWLSVLLRVRGPRRAVVVDLLLGAQKNFVVEKRVRDEAARA